MKILIRLTSSYVTSPRRVYPELAVQLLKADAGLRELACSWLEGLMRQMVVEMPDHLKDSFRGAVKMRDHHGVDVLIRYRPPEQTRF